MSASDIASPTSHWPARAAQGGVQRAERAFHLRHAARQQRLRTVRFGMENALEHHRHAAIGRAAGEPDQAQGVSTLATRGRQQALTAGLVLEPVEDRRRFGQHLAVVEHQHRHATERRILADAVEIGADDQARCSKV